MGQAPPARDWRPLLGEVLDLPLTWVVPHLHPIISPSHNTSIGPMSFPGYTPGYSPQPGQDGVPLQGQNRVLPARTEWGTQTGQDWMGTPPPHPGLDKILPSQDRIRYLLCPGQDRVCHWPRVDGVPPKPGQNEVPLPQPGQDGVTPCPRDRTEVWGLAMWQLVCFLCSCRKTVLLVNSFTMAVCEEIFHSSFGHKILTELKNISHGEPLKLFFTHVFQWFDGIPLILYCFGVKYQWRVKFLYWWTGLKRERYCSAL